MSANTATRAQQAEALDKLREYLKPGDTVYTVLRHVSSSGMTRDISAVLLRDNEHVDIDYLVARVLGYRRNQDHGGLRVSGCGMDMGFALVYDLSSKLFPRGHGCAGEHCPSNDHSNGDRDYTEHGRIVHGYPCATHTHWHPDGGYALRQRWI